MNIERENRLSVGKKLVISLRERQAQMVRKSSEARVRSILRELDQLGMLARLASWQIKNTLEMISIILLGLRVVEKPRNSMQPVERSLEKLMRAYLPMLMESVPFCLARLISESKVREGCNGHHWLRSLRSAFCPYKTGESLNPRRATFSHQFKIWAGEDEPHEVPA